MNFGLIALTHRVINGNRRKSYGSIKASGNKQHQSSPTPRVLVAELDQPPGLTGEMVTVRHLNEGERPEYD